MYALTYISPEQPHRHIRLPHKINIPPKIKTPPNNPLPHPNPPLPFPASLPQQQPQHFDNQPLQNKNYR